MADQPAITIIPGCETSSFVPSTCSSKKQNEQKKKIEKYQVLLGHDVSKTKEKETTENIEKNIYEYVEPVQKGVPFSPLFTHAWAGE